MNRLTVLSGAALVCLLVAVACPGWAAEGPWQKLYTGEEATGPNVVALWQFQPGQEAKDSSGRGHDLTLRGDSRFVKEGPFGGALESFRAGTDNDKAQGALAADADDLSPAGAFTIEAWYSLKPEAADSASMFLVDKKYFTYASDRPDANWDYALYMTKAGANQRRFAVTLGFGTDSVFINSPAFDVEPGKWQHVAFTYDGAGRCRFFLDGELLGKVDLPGRGPVTPGKNGVAIGDRHGSTHWGFPGYLAQVRISSGIVPYFTGGLIASTGGGRTAFLRMEKDVVIPVTLANDTTSALTGGRALVEFGGQKQDVRLPDLAPDQVHVIPVKVDTTVRPGAYMLKVSASGTSGGRALEAAQEVPIRIVARPLPNQMPVVMWGGGDIPSLKDIGFTHQLTGLLSENLVWDAGKPVPSLLSDGIERQGKLLDDLLANGLKAAVYLHPATWVTGDAKRKEQYNRVDRNGEVREHANVCGNFPEVRQFCYNCGASVAQTFGHYPALDGSLIQSEVRDGSNLCFHEHDKKAFRDYAGFDIPAEAASKGGLHYSRIKNFPANRVIPDDHQLLKFYQWFWKDGDGWNPIHSEISRGLKSTGRDDLWTFYDPAVRVPSTWGSGGSVDVISQWTYSYPDPLKIGQSTDELFAMAEGRPGQQVMKMTQIIWYRNGTAPKLPEDEAKYASWEKEKPQAPFITIAPDHLREAFWSKISRPVRGIMYHGWGSLVETGTTDKGYVFTNPETRGVLTELTRDVVKPLGPTLLQVPDRPTDVAMLESFSSQMFAGRGSYGWSNSWEADMHLILQWAHLQPKIVFDQTIVRDGLDKYRVLVMPSCDVLTESVAEKIKAFQKRGGIVVADESLCPAIIPDIVVTTRKRTAKADEDKAALQEKAAALRQELDPFYARYGDAVSPDMVLRFRQYRDSDYLFVLNDKRTYGNYVGHHGRVMEKGVPNASTVSVARKSGFIYDLVKHQEVPAKAVNGQMQFEVNLGGGDGRVFLVTPQAIKGVQVKTTGQARAGGNVEVAVTVVDSRNAPVAAVVPVQIEILDPQGRVAEGSGYYGAKGGKVSVPLALAPNDETGAWTVKVTELASGQSRQVPLAVKK